MKTANILTLLFLRYRILLFLLKTEKSPSNLRRTLGYQLGIRIPKKRKKKKENGNVKEKLGIRILQFLSVTRILSNKFNNA